MKQTTRAIIFIVALFFLWQSQLSAQNLPNLGKENEFQGFKERKLPFKQNVIKSNLIPIFMGQIPLCGELRFTYERMLTHNQSLTIGASYNFPNLFLFVMPAITNPGRATLKNYSLRGGRITLGYRFYPLKRRHAPNGLFFGPYGSFNFVKIKERKGNGSFETWNYADACFILGYQFHMRRGVFMEFFGGLGYRKNFIRDYDARYNSTSEREYYVIKGPVPNFKVLLQMNIGFGW
ncbi:MAG: DUF3575 domain-containing protein [Bacteroidetes bacterium]|nr:DUF3575 domain-containing protein [Bacteroidota bacterium]